MTQLTTSPVKELRCTECGRPVRHLPQGYQTGDAVYCQEHIALTARDPRFVIPDAIKAAERDMMQPADQLIDWCLPELTDTFGYLLPGTVTYGCAFPKNGKTAFLSNNLHYWDRCGVRVWVMPTESRPKGLITRLAAFRVGVPAEEALSRRLRVRMESGDPHAFEQMTSLMSEFSRMAHETRTDGSNIAIEPSPRLTRSVFRKSVAAASAGGYGLVVVDHVDHIQADEGESEYTTSAGVQHDALEFAEQYELPILLMSQLNTSRVGRDLLYRYRRPNTDWLWMKGTKDQIATTMFGVYRPMDPNVDDKILQDAKDGKAEGWRVAMTNTMGVADMLSRYGGARPDRTVLLDYRDGVLASKPAPDLYAMQSDYHGIYTGSPSGFERRVS
jgi:hypothetical protein